MEPTSSPWIEVRRSEIHGTGVYAAKDIPKKTRLIEYVGERINKEEAERRGNALYEKSQREGGAAVLIFYLNKKWDLDGDVPWNTGKYFNHSCEPNCETNSHKGRIWVKALRDIKQGEELTYNYGYDLEDFEDHPCRCGSSQCVGYIVEEELWPELKKRIADRITAPLPVC